MKVLDRKHAIAIAFGRIVIGIIFLWAGLEKIIGEGLGTFSAAGFLEFGTGGTLGWPFVSGEVAEGTVFNPTHDFWVALAGNAGGDVDHQRHRPARARSPSGSA